MYKEGKAYGREGDNHYHRQTVRKRRTGSGGEAGEGTGDSFL